MRKSLNNVRFNKQNEEMCAGLYVYQRQPCISCICVVGWCVCVCFVSTSADRVVNPSIPVKYTPKHYIYTNIVLLWQQVACRHQWLVLVIHECRYRNIVNLPMYLISPLRKKLFQSGFFVSGISSPKPKCQS